MPTSRQSLSLWMATALLLANTLAACRALGVPAGADPVSAPATASSPSAMPAALPTAPTPALAPPGADAPGVGWRQLGQLVPNSANGPTIATLAIDAVTPTTLYAGTLYTIDNQIGVYRSSDGGARWQPATDGLPITTDGTGVEGLVIAPQRPATLYAFGHFDGLWRSDDHGTHWQLTGLKIGYVSALLLDPRTPDRLYVLTGDGVQHSIDGGTSWQHIGADLPASTSVAFVSLQIEPQQPDTLYLGASFGGVFRSVDAGEHWSAMNSGLPDQPVLDGLFLDPQSRSLYVDITGAGLYRSTDGGGHWSQASDQEYLAITPASSGVLYAIAHSSLVRSADSGASWQVVAAVRCGVQSLAPMRQGGVAAGCLDGRIYALQ